MRGLTSKQAELLSFIKEYAAGNAGAAPSYDEMREALGLASKSGIHRLVVALERRGHIERSSYEARSIRVNSSYGLENFSTCALVAELARRSELKRRAA